MPDEMLMDTPELGGADLGGLGGDVEPEVDTPELPDGSDQTAEEEPQQEPETPQETEEPAEPEREMLPKELAKQLRQFKQAHAEDPDALKALREMQNAYYNRQSYRNVFPTTEDAIQARADLDAAGGREGIEYLQLAREKMDEIDQQIDVGDPAPIEAMAQASPEGFSKLVPHALKILQRMNFNAYQEALQPILLESLDAGGITDTLQSAIEELRGGDTDRAARQLNRLAAWITDLRSQEQNRRSMAQNPRIQEAEAQAKRLAGENERLLRDNATRDLRSYFSDRVNRDIANIVRERRLSADAARDLVGGIGSEIDRMLSETPGYAENYARFVKRGDITRLIQYGKSMQDKVRQAAIKSVVGRRYGTAPVRRPVAGTEALRGPGANGQRPIQPRNQVQAAPAANGRPAFVARKPEHGDQPWNIDNNRTTMDMHMAGTAYLRNGKLVTWKRPQA